tara:strand:+ start:153 stop:872 length:720 start_codon:yes stop_codon:yes gene_type:complete
MKIKKILNLLSVIYDSKLPYDMELLDKQFYTSESQDKTYAIDDMNIIHFIRSFIKMQRNLNEEVRRDTQEGKVVELEQEVARLKKDNDKFYGRYDEGLQQSVSQTNQIMKLEQEVSRLREKLASDERARIMRIKDLNKQNHALQELNIQIKERNQDLHKRLEEKSYKEVTAPRYVFSEIPRDMYGEAFVDTLKKYLNKSRYSMRVRGQHIREDLKGRGLTEHGQSIEQSTHLRVYIEEK